MNRLLNPIQDKVACNKPGNAFEQEEQEASDADSFEPFLKALVLKKALDLIHIPTDKELERK